MDRRDPGARYRVGQGTGMDCQRVRRVIVSLAHWSSRRGGLAWRDCSTAISGTWVDCTRRRVDHWWWVLPRWSASGARFVGKPATAELPVIHST